MNCYIYVPISTDNQLLVFSMDADSGQLQPISRTNGASFSEPSRLQAIPFLLDSCNQA